MNADQRILPLVSSRRYATTHNDESSLAIS